MRLFRPNIEKLEQQRNVRGLTEALKDKEAVVREAAASALDRIGVPDDPAVRAWYAVAKKNWAAAGTLGEAAVEPLCSSLKDPDPKVRDAAADVLDTVYCATDECGMGLGRNIKLIRTARGLRASELAQAVDISPSYLSLVEREKKEPSLKLARKIADELGVPLGLLFWQTDVSHGEATDMVGVNPDLVRLLFGMMAELNHSGRDAFSGRTRKSGGCARAKRKDS